MTLPCALTLLGEAPTCILLHVGVYHHADRAVQHYCCTACAVKAGKVCMSSGGKQPMGLHSQYYMAGVALHCAIWVGLPPIPTTGHIHNNTLVQSSQCNVMHSLYIQSLCLDQTIVFQACGSNKLHLCLSSVAHEMCTTTNKTK